MIKTPAKTLQILKSTSGKTFYVAELHMHIKIEVEVEDKQKMHHGSGRGRPF